MQQVNDEIQNLKTFILYIADAGKERLHQEMAKLYLSQGLAQSALAVLQNTPESKIKTHLMFLAYILAEKPITALSLWNEIDNPSFDLKLWKNGIILMHYFLM